MSIVLIGGGDHIDDLEPSYIDSNIVSMTQKDHPNFLFIGLASHYSDSKYDQMKKIYQKLGCNCQYLKKKNLIHNPSIVEDKINSSDIIYFCGGDTLKLLEEISSFQLEDLLKKAYQRGTILVGSSAGAILLSKKGFSDSFILRGEKDTYSFVDGLGFCDYSICPHYHEDSSKTSQLKDFLKDSNDIIYGLEEGTAMVVDGNKLSFLNSSNHFVYKVTYHKSFVEEKCQ